MYSVRILKGVLFFLPGLAFGQVTLSPTLGLSTKTSVMIFPRFQHLEKSLGMYPYEGDAYIAITTGALISYAKWNLEYFPGVHYNKVRIEIRNGRVERPKEFLIDQTIQCSYGKQGRLGIGYSIFNTGQTLKYISGGEEYSQNIQYDAVKLSGDVSFRSILTAELSIYYLRNGWPNNPKPEAWIWGLRILHTFRLLEK